MVGCSFESRKIFVTRHEATKYSVNNKHGIKLDRYQIAALFVFTNSSFIYRRCKKTRELYLKHVRI